MSLAIMILLFVAVQRLLELRYSKLNTRRLLSGGAKEFSPEHYRWIVVLHAAWIMSLAVGIYFRVQIHFGWLVLFFVLQALRIWVLVTLGPYWTTRIIRPADNFRVTKGPYRFFRHPNYLVVAGEIFALPMALGWPEIAGLFSILNLIILSVRIRAENLALDFGAAKSQP